LRYTAAESRYENTAPDWFRRCGASGLMLPAISLGCWHNFGDAGTIAAGPADEASMHANARQMLFTAFDAGITHFDLANNYGPEPGAAETRVGRILKEDLARYRDELIISSKAGYRMWPGPYGEWGSRKYLIASLDASLKRLQLEYVDIFYSHRFDPDTPLEETLFALDLAVRQGKALYVGISSYSGQQTLDAIRLCEQNDWVKPIIHQPNYSMLNRWIENDLLPVTSRFGLGAIAFCPLAQGVLTDKYLREIPKDSRAALGRTLKKDRLTPETLDKIGKLNRIAVARGQSLAQLALQWVLRPQQHGQVTSALIGASRPSQIAENVRAVAGPAISTDETAAIDAILAAK
jgi:L-glyceraldehyde 3-phosphate reductase